MKPLSPAWESDEPLRALAAASERLWVGTDAGLHVLRRDGRTLLSHGKAALSVTALCMDGGKLWIASQEGVHVLDAASERATPGPRLAGISGITGMVKLGDRLYAAGETTMHVIEGASTDAGPLVWRTFDLAPHIGAHPITCLHGQGDRLILTTLGGGVAVVETRRLNAP